MPSPDFIPLKPVIWRAYNLLIRVGQLDKFPYPKLRSEMASQVIHQILFAIEKSNSTTDWEVAN